MPKGLYVFPSLEVGTYDLRVESQNFAATEIHGLILAAGKTQTIDVSLHPAGAKESINVAGVNETVNLNVADDLEYSTERQELSRACISRSNRLHYGAIFASSRQAVQN